ncbi:YqcI/YcgG family protein [Bacillus sp. V59.32b]|uniref:YqcI/YcgG family protein n=1 Tax=Bacillus sp. V59.32b TaxID=1758642 RepID=UPI000E3C85D8|nr:YqcI/YcgG family protein [Bacillus sp. V59.32b]RFU66885.1 YqcI/YcgG family protein [Bacillus sp. V59.32b]
MKIFNKYNNQSALSSWQLAALDSFSEKMSDSTKMFPCIPATQGFALNQLRYGFAGKPGEETTSAEVAALLKEFTIQSREFGNYTSLIVFLDTPDEMVEDGSVDYFEELFWKLLNQMAAIDEKEWVVPIPLDPENSLWEYCFHGERYFIYCATPAHVNRKSRHFPCFMLAITPRWALTNFDHNSKYANKIRDNIKARLIEYDSIPPHSSLNTYGSANNFEWKQYFLRDDATSLGSCPFSRKK